MAKSKNILITNDDGINAPGLFALYEAVKALGNVYVVAPATDQSAASHSFTLRKPIKIREIKKHWFSVEGTPTDCVLIAYHAILNKSIDLVISGINNGPNLGDDVLYSGTVAAAIEGAILGIPAMAVSYLKDGVNTQPAQNFVCKLAGYLLKYRLPKKTLLNINIPADDFKGIKVTNLGKRIYQDMAIRRLGPNDEVTYTIDGEMGFKLKRGSDFAAVYNGYLSITPLHLDMTHYRELARFRKIFARLFSPNRLRRINQ
uniref:5'-nucleotidase SurE n=1 Tax=candidate division WOR-3 bacterium TaxID=2052148 RepID=A0A7C6A979_UNCW3